MILNIPQRKLPAPHPHITVVAHIWSNSHSQMLYFPIASLCLRLCGCLVGLTTIINTHCAACSLLHAYLPKQASALSYFFMISTIINTLSVNHWQFKFKCLSTINDFVIKKKDTVLKTSWIWTGTKALCPLINWRKTFALRREEKNSDTIFTRTVFCCNLLLWECLNACLIEGLNLKFKISTKGNRLTIPQRCNYIFSPSILIFSSSQVATAALQRSGIFKTQVLLWWPPICFFCPTTKAWCKPMKMIPGVQIG